MVDDATMRGSSPAEVRARLDEHARGLDQAYNGRPSAPVFREVAWAAQRFAVHRAPEEGQFRLAAAAVENT